MNRNAVGPKRGKHGLPPLADRVKAALAKGYHTLGHLEHVVFPEEQFPRAFRCAVQGGPPGCRMVLVAALKRYRVPISHPADCNARALVGPWPGMSCPVEVFDGFARKNILAKPRFPQQKDK